MEHVVEAPHRYRIERNPDIRRVGVERFPFHVVFRETPNGVQVPQLLITGGVRPTG
jgi:hypothetical protein